ncbi:hypothetical protein AAHB60_06230 [Pseudomonas aeruginosa]
MTNGHHGEVTAENWKQLAIGQTGSEVLRRRRLRARAPGVDGCRCDPRLRGGKARALHGA